MRASWLVGVVAAAGVIGGATGAVLVGVLPHERAPAGSSTQSSHVQDVTLCTTYALIDAAIHHPAGTGADVLPAIAPLRLGLIENPDADPQIRAAISAAVSAFDAILAKDAQPRGLSEPPPYDRSAVSAAFVRASQVCGLN